MKRTKQPNVFTSIANDLFVLAVGLGAAAFVLLGLVEVLELLLEALT